MSLTIAAATVRLRRHLKAAEMKSDEALLAKLELMSSMVLARQSVETGAGAIGQKAIVRLARSMQAEIDATSDLYRAHEDLRRDCRDAGFIPDEEKPKTLHDEDVARVA